MKSTNQATKTKRAVRPQRGAEFLRAFVAIVLLPVCASAGDVGGYPSSSVANPAGSATVPPSSYQSGLVTRPNPVDSSGNLVMTGNVGAGKHFRGAIPYRSGTSMSTPLGSTSLDSFLRYTAPTEAVVTSPGMYSPYYSSGTAAAMPPGTRSVLSPGLSGLGTGLVQRPVDTTGSALYPNSTFRVLSGDATDTPMSNTESTAPRLQLWSPTVPSETAAGRSTLDSPWLSRTPSNSGTGPSSVPDSARTEIARPYGWLPGLQTGDGEAPVESSQNLLGSDRVTSSRPETVTNDTYRQEMEALQQRLGQVKAEVAQLEQSLASREEMAPSESDVSEFDRSEGSFPSSGFGMGIANPSAVSNPQSEMSAASRREQLLEETARLLSRTTTGSTTLPNLPAIPTPLGDTNGTTSDRETDEAPRLQLYNPNRMYSATGLKPALPTPYRAQTGISANPQAAIRHRQPMAPDTPVVQTTVQSPVRAAEPDPSVTSLREFARHIQLAERYLHSGEYSHAAETFALATAYRPMDPHAHLGRSQALLAAGQFDASAMSLAKAIELDPSYVLKKVDLIDIVGGPDAFIARFDGLDEALQTSDAPMLQLLMAYICLQMDRTTEARVALDTAQRLLPSSRPIGLLQTAVGRP